MKKHDFHIGPGAASLILVAVVVSMGILGLLTMVTVHTDVTISQRSLEAVEAQYKASVQAEKDLQGLDEIVVQLLRETQDDDAFYEKLEMRLPVGMEIDENTISWDVPVLEQSVLHCSVKVSNSVKTDRILWVKHQYESFMDTSTFD